MCVDYLIILEIYATYGVLRRFPTTFKSSFEDCRIFPIHVTVSLLFSKKYSAAPCCSGSNFTVEILYSHPLSQAHFKDVNMRTS